MLAPPLPPRPLPLCLKGAQRRNRECAVCDGAPQAAEREGRAAAAEREREGGAGGHRSGRHCQAKVRPISGTGPGLRALNYR
jgi:hypothetical protein